MTSSSISTSLIVVVAVLIVLLAIELTRSTDGRGKLSQGRADRQSAVIETTNSAQSSAQFSIGTWNIHRGRDGADQLTLADMPKAVESLDVLALQEVGGGGWGEGDNHARYLARETALATWIFAPTRLRWFRPKGGNGLASRAPLDNVVATSLNSSWRDYRATLAADIALGDETVRVINVHLSRDDMRPSQLAAVIEMFLAHPRAVLLGDFNLTRDNPQLAELLDRDDVEEAIAVIEQRKAQTLRLGHHVDWVFSRGFEVIDARIVENGLSDHPLLMATLRVR